MNVIIYTKANCPNCVTAKALLLARELAYQEHDVEKDATALCALLTAYPDARQMPQVFINGQRVGGLAGLEAALKQLGL